MPFHSMNEPDAIRLMHMLEAAEEALRTAGGRNRDELLLDRTVTLVVMKDIVLTMSLSAPAGGLGSCESVSDESMGNPVCVRVSPVSGDKHLNSGL